MDINYQETALRESEKKTYFAPTGGRLISHGYTVSFSGDKETDKQVFFNTLSQNKASIFSEANLVKDLNQDRPPLHSKFL